MLTLKELIEYDPTVEFVNDVQLAHYRSPNNCCLVGNYIFTRNAVNGKKSSTELLRSLCEAYHPGNHPNRFVIQATYGHGKSHFALAAANFFGKSFESDESKVIIERLQHSLSEPENEAPFAFFRNFKTIHRPFLILIMTGQDGADLPTKFFQAVDDALLADGTVGDLNPPFWYKNAARAVNDLMEIPSLKEKVAKRKPVIDKLIGRIREKDHTARGDVIQLFRELERVPPDMNEGSDLTEAMKWLCTNAVGNEKPYGGILILFDEFYAFIRDFAHNRSAGTPLQSLLNGVENGSGKVCFCAFAQRDPDTMAEFVYRNNPAELATLMTELNRLPKNNRYDLHSCLEEVLDAYLKQKTQAWEKVIREPGISRELGAANDLAYDIFSYRYQDELKWDMERFQKVVTQGCFPLHPLTTALLSCIDFGANDDEGMTSAATARRLLSFVAKNVKPLMRQDVIQKGRLQWVRPLTLIEYFQEMLGDKAWREYQNARQHAGGADIPDKHHRVLKAMLLIIVGKLKTRGAYDRVVAAIADLKIEEAKEILALLTTQSCIQHNDLQKTYSFWPSGKGIGPVDELIGKKRSLWTFNVQGAEELLKALSVDEILTPVEIPVTWGNSQDWSMKQFLLPPSLVQLNVVSSLLREHTHWSIEGPNARGLTIWVLPDNESQIEPTRNSIRTLLSELGPVPQPLVINMPRNSTASISRLFADFMAVLRFTADEIQTVGQEQYNARKRGILDQIKEHLRILHSGLAHEPCFQECFRPRIAAARPKSAIDCAKEILGMVYPDGPRKWSFDYSLTSTNFNKETIFLANHLCSNSLSGTHLSGKSQASDICKKGLQNAFGVLSSDYGLHKPLPNTDAGKGWAYLDEKFPSDHKQYRIETVLTALLNPPFGFDFNTVLLLFSTWWGFYVDDLQLVKGPCIQKFGDLFKDSKGNSHKNCRAVLKSFSGWYVRRAPAEEIHKKMQDRVDRISRFETVSKQEAQDELASWENYLKRTDLPEREKFVRAFAEFKRDYDQVAHYEKYSRELQNRANQATNMALLVQVQADGKKLVLPKLIQVDALSPNQMQELIKESANQIVNGELRAAEEASTPESCAVVFPALQSIEAALLDLGYSELRSRVIAAQSDLKAREDTLKRHKVEGRLLEKWGSIPFEKLDLVDLRKQIADLDMLSLSTPDAKKQRQAYKEKVQKEILALEEFVSKVEKNLESGVCWRDFQKIVLDINSCLARFGETELLARLEKAMGTASRFEGLFRFFSESLEMEFSHPEQVAGVIIQMKGRLEKELEFPGTAQKGILQGQLDKVGGILTQLTQQLGAIEQAKNDDLILQKWETLFVEKTDLRILRDLECEISKVSLVTIEGRERLGRVKAKIVKEVETLQGMVTGFEKKLDQVVKSGQIEAISAEVHRQDQRFFATEFQDAVSAVSQRAATLRGFFRDLEDIQRKPCKELSEMAEVLDRLTKIQTEFQDSLSKSQKVLLEDVIRGVAEKHKVLSDQFDEQNRKFQDEKRIVEFDRIQIDQCGLVDLKNKVKEVNSLEFVTTEGKKRGKKVEASFQREIDALEKVVREFTSKVERAKKHIEFENIEAEISRVEKRFVDSAFEKPLFDLRKRAALLRANFREFHDQMGRTFSSQEEAAEVVKKLQLALDKATGQLHQEQRTFLSDQIDDVKKGIFDKSQKAISWLNDLEGNVEKLEEKKTGRSPDRLVEMLRAVEAPPSFLPESETKRLGKLRTKIQALLDDDAILQVEVAFKKIKSAAQRKKLLQKLQKAFEQEEE